MTLFPQRVHAFCWTKKETLIKKQGIENGKSQTQFLRDEPVASVYIRIENLKKNFVKFSKTKLELLKQKSGHFLYHSFLPKEIFLTFHLCFIPMYIALNTLSEYRYFYISKSINSYTFLVVFKIVETQSPFSCSKLTIETLQQDVKYVQS